MINRHDTKSNADDLTNYEILILARVFLYIKGYNAENNITFKKSYPLNI